jgi:hypothetical protein
MSMSRFDHRLAAGASRACLGQLRRALRVLPTLCPGSPLRTLTRAAAALLAALLWSASAPALAAAVTYQATALGNDAWRYDYVVKNDGSPAAIEEFTIFFELGLYADLAATAWPADWEPLVVQPDPGLPADGFFDALALGAGLMSGEEALFSVTFTYNGPNAPGSQAFHVVNPDPFGIIDRGLTSAAVALPEPGTLPLLLMAAAALLVLRSPRRLAVHASARSDPTRHMAVAVAAVLRRLKAHFIALGSVALLLAIGGCGGGSGQSGAPQAASGRQQVLAVGGTTGGSLARLSVDALTLKAERRISRTVFEYDYQLRVANAGGPLIGVTVELVGAGAGTQVVDGTALAGTLAAGAMGMTSDTITIRQDRTRPLQLNQLSWHFAVAPVIQGTAAVGAALANATVEVTDRAKTPACHESPIHTNGLGSFTCTVRPGLTAPLLVVVRDAFQAYAPIVSIVDSLPPAGSALVTNATPLTTAIVSQLAPNGNALALRDDPSLIDLGKLATIKANVLAQLQAVLAALNVPAGYDPFTTPIVAATPNQPGNTADNILELLRFSTVAGVNRIGTIDNPGGVVLAGTSAGPLLPAPSAGALALGSTMQQMTNAFNACFALPVNQRALAVNTSIPANQGGPEVTSLAAACQNIWHPDYRQSGYRAGQRYFGALRDNAMVGASFALPEIMLFRDDTSAADNDVVVLNFRFVDANGIASNFIEVARKLPGSATSQHPSDWWMHGNRSVIDSSVQPVIRRNEQLVPNPGTAPFQLTGTSRFEAGFNFFVNKDGPGSAGLRAVRVTGPALPLAGLVLTRPNPAIVTDQNWMNIRRKDGLTDAASATFAGNNGNTFLLQRTVGLLGTDAVTVRPNPNAGNGDNLAFPNWAHPLDYGLPPGTTNYVDFALLTSGAVYTYEYFYDGETAPRHVDTKTSLAPVTPSTHAVHLQWIDLTTQTRNYLSPTDPLAQPQTVINLAWIANSFAETVASAGVYTFNGSQVVNDSVINFPRGATSAQAVAPVGVPFPALTATGTSGRNIQLRYRMLDGSYKDSLTRYN